MSADIIVVDQFCGGGGASQGLMQAAAKLKKSVRVIAINHSPEAVATFHRNHPEQPKPICQDVELVHPRQAVPGGRVDILLSGFECTFFSSARGGKPVNDQGRQGAWQVPEWCSELDVRQVLAENVPEFVNWGPLCTLEPGHAGPHWHEDGQDTEGRCEKPVRERRAEYFRQWLQEFTNLGYQYEWRIINAADHGAVTSRRRWFFRARKDGRPIHWPLQTNVSASRGDLFGERPVWRPSREVLDLDDLGTSMFGRKKPLSPNTLLRAARGLLLFGGPWGPYFVNALGLTEEQLSKLPRPRSTTWSPFVFGNRTNNLARDLDEPLPTATTTTGGGMILVQPFLLGQQSGAVARSSELPVPTIAAGGAISLVQPFLIGQRDSWDGKQSVPGRPRGLGEPMQTITTDPGITLVRPFLNLYYGNGQPDSIDEPLSTLTTKARHALASPIVVPYGPRADVRSVHEPLPTILTKDRLGLALPTFEPFIVPNFGERQGQAPRVHPIDGPLPTVTSRGAGNLITPAVLQPEDVAGMDPRRLIWIGEELHLLDIFYRMLRNHELAAAMGFPRRYWFAGKPRDITRQIGNAWEINVAEALATTILVDLFDVPLEVAA